jgi:hypothetical protein
MILRTPLFLQVSFRSPCTTNFIMLTSAKKTLMNHRISPVAPPSESHPRHMLQLPLSAVLFKSKARSTSQTSKRLDGKTREERCRWNMSHLNLLPSVAMRQLLLRPRLVPGARVKDQWRFLQRTLPTRAQLAHPSEPRLRLHQTHTQFHLPSAQGAISSARRPNQLLNNWEAPDHRPVLPLEARCLPTQDYLVLEAILMGNQLLALPESKLKDASHSQEANSTQQSPVTETPTHNLPPTETLLTLRPLLGMIEALSRVVATNVPALWANSVKNSLAKEVRYLAARLTLISLKLRRLKKFHDRTPLSV